MDDTDSLLEFPCDFPIKAMGLAVEGFDRQVTELVRRHVPERDVDAVRSRSSQGGKYLAVTITVRATSRAQLDAIYQELTACEAVLMAL